MFIQTESTPNPATLKFLPGQTVLEAGTADFPTADSAAASPLAQRVFAVGNVTGVFLGSDFVTVTKEDATDWDHIKPAILGAIMEHFQSGAQVMDTHASAAGGHAEHDGPDSEIVKQIKELLDTRVRPAVAQDGGDITFHGFDRGIVYLHMQGACAGCPSSTLTLKMGIENLLRHYIPEVLEVRPVAAQVSEMTAEELAALHSASFQTPRPWSAKDFAGLLSMRENFIITGDGPSFIMGRYAAHEAEVLTLAVHPEARGRGLGRVMLRAYEEEARSRLALMSFLEVAENNTVAISLYLSEGYSESGRRPHYYTTPENEKIDALVLSKPLKHT